MGQGVAFANLSRPVIGPGISKRLIHVFGKLIDKFIFVVIWQE
jgi:hypothetical protein